jgi:hypothetical protein
VPLFFFKKETDTLDEVGRMVSRSFHPDSSKKGMQSYLHSIRRFALKAISSLFLIPLLFSCSPRISSNFPGASSVTSISTELKGTIFPLVDSLFSDYDASSSLPSFIRSAFSSTCDYRDVTVAIYKLDEAGNTDATPVASVSLLDEKANYRFEDAKSLGIDPSPSAKLEYILKVSGCGDTEIRAPITGLGAFDVTAGVALMGLLSQGTAEQKALLREKTPEELSALMTALSSRLSKNATIAQAFTELAADPELKSQFEASFGHSLSVSDLQNVEPHAMSLTWPKNPVPEGRTSSFFVAASHWNPNYTIRYLWKLDGVIVSHAAVFNYTPEKNHQGTHVLSLYMGADNGSGAINTTTPYFYQSESFTVENTFPPTAPAFQFSGAGILTASTQNQFNVQTGTNRVNCATFSSFAITENTNAPPSDLDFDFTCDSAGTQAITYDFLNTSDGPKTLRLWTRDSIGTLSATPSTFTVFLDRTAPTTSIGSGPSGITNATSGTFSFSGVDPGGGAIAGYECKLDSGSYQACSSPFTTPTLSAGSHTFLVRATDTLGNVSSLASRTWTIDLTAPTLSLDSQPSSLNANTSATFTFSAVDTGGGTVSGYQCKLNSGSFTSCTSPYTITGLPSGAQSVSIKAFDSAGNSSSVSTTSWTIDRTGPNVSILSSPPSVTYLGSGSFSFTGTDSGGSSVGGYECKIDSSAYSACTSPKSFASLSDGNHQFSVRATDQLGNTGAATNYSWNVDSSSSLATISVHPANISNVTSPSFSFDASSSSGVAAFECKLDSASFTACTSPQSYTGLTEGSHTFSVRPIDASANAGVAVSFSWTLDTTAPIATISSGPNAVVNSTAGSLSFSGTDSGGATISSYECKLDSASYTSCSSPLSFSALSVGSHTYSIRAVDSAGNTGTAATRSWTIDQTAPTLSLTSSPVALTNATSATFQFSATDAGGSTVAGFECALDGGAYSACSSPAALTSLGAGAHSYAIRASDAVGNTSGSTTHSWTIDLSAPAVTLGTKPNAFTNSSSAAFTFTGSDTGGGTVSSFECKIDSGNFSACTSPQTLTGLSSAAHTYSVRAIDSAGNTGSPTSHTWTIDTTAPSATIVTGPSSLTNSTSATFTFSATDAGGGSIDSFECKVDSESFSTCTSPKNYTGIVDGAHTFSVRAIDTAGNTGTAATQTWTVDATAPGAPSVVFQLNSASSLISNTQSLNLTVASCTDRNKILVTESNNTPTSGDAAWQNCATSAGAISYTLSTSTQGSRFLKIWAMDTATNISATSSTLSYSFDNVAPTISAFTLANGAANVGLPSVSVSLTASDSANSITEMQITESSSISGSDWVTYSGTSTIILSQTNGQKTVYAWVKDAAGNASSASTYAIALDFGTPPILTVSSPTTGDTYSTGASVPISWNCSSANGLDANYPITSVQYTDDDGVTYCPITTNLAGASGTYSGWSIPATDCQNRSTTNRSFRISVSCKSVAGIVTNAFSQYFNTGGWSVFAGDPWNALKDINASIAQVSESSSVRSTLTGDAAGNIYYVYKNAIMKIDATTGLVTIFAGAQDTSGCTIGTGTSLATGTLGAPQILGTSSDQNSLLVYQPNCTNILGIQTSTGAVTVMASSITASAPVLTKNRFLVYYTGSSHLNARVWKLDLKSAGNTPVWVTGTGAGVCGLGATGSDAKLSPLKCSVDSSANAVLLIANADATSIWLTVYNGGAATRYDWDASASQYVIAVPSVSWSTVNMTRCLATDFDSYIYCNNWHSGREIRAFDPITGTWVSGTQQIPFPNNDSSGLLTVGAMKNQLLSIYSLNMIHSIKPNHSTGVWDYVSIAGQSLTTMGNGGPLGGVGFSQPTEIKYNEASQILWIRNAIGHARLIEFANSNAVSTRLFNGGSADMGSTYPALFLNLAGTKLAVPGSWSSWTRLTDYTISSTILTFANYFMSRGSATNNTYPVPSGTNPQLDIGNIRNSNFGNLAYQNMVFHSNGKLYFGARNATTTTDDVFIYSSDKSVINRVAGKTGTGGYVSGDHGATALGASLTYVQHLFEIPSGSYAGDLLIVDGNWLRRVSITTESSSPKIYDVFALSGVTGYTAGTAFMDFVYDWDSEVNGALGTGIMYYVNGSRVVRKLTPSSSLNGGTDTAYSFNGTSLTGTIRITLSPAGLLVLQPAKTRILRVAP